jgi:hypothetical protein
MRKRLVKPRLAELEIIATHTSTRDEIGVERVIEGNQDRPQMVNDPNGVQKWP